MATPPRSMPSSISPRDGDFDRRPSRRRRNDEARRNDGARRSDQEQPSGDRDVAITLANARWRHFVWSVLELASGLWLVLEMGPIVRVLGILLLGLALRNGYRFMRTLLYDSGTIVVNKASISVPIGLCQGQTETFAMGEVRHAFLLRRAVPWSQSGPTLIVEAGEHAFAYPRDWFHSDGDQQRIVRAIRHHLGQE